jgi:hypothetical protein
VEVIVDVRWFENRPLGDANRDGRFDELDLIQVMARGEYEDSLPGNSSYDEGDWNADGEFDSSDLVAALAYGRYEEAMVAESANFTSPNSPLPMTRKLSVSTARELRQILSCPTTRQSILWPLPQASAGKAGLKPGANIRS